jgi:hypothetical protein
MAGHIPIVPQRRLAQALRELRPEAGLTQDAVAARMGWHASKPALFLTGLTRMGHRTGSDAFTHVQRPISAEMTSRHKPIPHRTYR